MGATHLGALSKLPDVEVVAISSANPRVLAGDLSETGGNLKRAPVEVDLSRVRKYQTWHELVHDRELDAVDICLPTHLHKPATLEALQLGKHVLCEKPMAGTVADCAAMIEAAQSNERILMIAQVLRFWPEYMVLQDFVRSASYGKVRSATFVRRAGIPDWSRWLTEDTLSGGAVLDLLVHDVDQILMLFGMPKRVAAKSLGGPDTLSAAFIYEDPIEIRLQGGWFAAGSPFSMSYQIRAERALLDWTSDGLVLSDEKGEKMVVEVSRRDPYESELAYFIACCKNGVSPDRCPPTDSAKAVELALMLKESRAAGGAQITCLV